MSPSSRGLGHRPFTAVTGVRIPLGTPTRTAHYGKYTEWMPAHSSGRLHEIGVVRRPTCTSPFRSSTGIIAQPFGDLCTNQMTTAGGADAVGLLRLGWHPRAEHCTRAGRGDHEIGCCGNAARGRGDVGIAHRPLDDGFVGWSPGRRRTPVSAMRAMRAGVGGGRCREAGEAAEIPSRSALTSSQNRSAAGLFSIP
jgi:hypothetical protein